MMIHRATPPVDASPPPRPQRAAVLLVVHPDGCLEAFAERHIDVRIARMPDAYTPEGERLAEDCLELMLPRRYRDLWRRDLLRAVGTADLLRPQAVLDALATRDTIAAINGVSDAKGAA